MEKFEEKKRQKMPSLGGTKSNTGEARPLNLVFREVKFLPTIFSGEICKCRFFFN